MLFLVVFRTTKGITRQYNRKENISIVKKALIIEADKIAMADNIKEAIKMNL
jgi:hypothetical protein